MGSTNTKIAFAMAAAVLALAATAGVSTDAADAGQKVGVLKTKNRTATNRGIRNLDRVVVHVTEGSFWGSIRWLRNPRSHGSSHFIVSREGEVVQLVSTTDVAWHAGNRRTNARSIGIEHEGFTKRGGFTKAQYEASARLLAYLSLRMGMPLDRRHVIGHDEVPHPSARGRRGGIDGHTDPGPRWRWRRYLALARRYAKEVERPLFVRISAPRVARPKVVERRVRCGHRRSIHSTTIYDGQTVAGIVPWRAQACGKRLHRVDFLVDGRPLWRDRVRPFGFARGRGFNTTTLVNGWHTFTLRAFGPRGHRVRKMLRVRVENKPFAVAPAGVSEGQAVQGIVDVLARPNAPAKRVSLVVDGEVVDTSTARPHRLAWNSVTAPNGPVELVVHAEAVDGRRTSLPVPLLVANREPTPEPTPRIAWQSLARWQTVSGIVPWGTLVDGPVEQVEFWIDGALRWAARDEPYAFGGAGGVWDAGAERPGLHELVVRAIGPGGRVAESRSLVLVAAP